MITYLITNAGGCMTIADKNDRIRVQLPQIPKPHRLVLSDEVAELPSEILGEVLILFRNFSSFNFENDPYSEHDFISVELNENIFFLKIDYYDEFFQFFKIDGHRVISIMYSHEY